MGWGQATVSRNGCNGVLDAGHLVPEFAFRIDAWALEGDRTWLPYREKPLI